MRRRTLLAGALALALLSAKPVKADTGVIVRTTGGLSALNILCALPTVCTVVGGLDGALGQVFLITTPLPLANLLPLLQGLTGFVDAEADQVLNLVGLANLVPSPISSTLMSDRTLIAYPANSGTMVWNSYATQSAADIVEVRQAQSTFHVTGTGIVADIDTGVDPNHPALQGVLLAGYDFTRNQAGGSELNDLKPSDFPTYPPPSCSATTCSSPAQVNQSSAAILDQSSAAILDTNTQYAAFGHGTMVMGIIHLVAPTAQLLPLKAFHSDGTANLSDILRAIYYAGQNNANVINMSFDIKTASTELKDALDYVNQLGVICAASAGNDGTQETVYPAALQNDVMGVASVGSTTSTDGTRSSFSNFGDAIVWAAAPGESIISTYPFDSYAAGWGTSFSAPFVSGGAALLRGLLITINEAGAAAAVAHAASLSDAGMGKGRLDLVPALQSLTPGGGSPDFAVSAAPVSATITAGQTANYTISATPTNGFNQAVTWSCVGAPAAATCAVSPNSVTLDGTHAATATVTLITTARAISPPLLWPRAAQAPHRWLVFELGLALTMILLILLYLGRTPRWRQGLAAAAALLAVGLFAYSCGGGYGGPPGSTTTLYSIGLNPTSVTGGSPSTGTVTLSGPAPSGGVVVSLSSSASTATVPANVTVAGGATSATFTVTTNAVTTSTQVTISGSYGGINKTASLTVNLATVAALSSVALNPSTVNGGTSSTGTVTLSGSAPSGGAIVSLSSSAAAATVPASVTVVSGATTATFTVTTSAVTAATPVTISASYGGTTKTTLLTVNPATVAALSSVALNPATVNGGTSSTGTVTLSGPAPSGGAIVSLSSSAAAATVPASVTVASGATTATFTVTTSAVTAATPVTVSASYGGTTKTTLLTVNPATIGGTPAGTYTLTVTGTSGTLSHATTVTVVVN